MIMVFIEHIIAFVAGTLFGVYFVMKMVDEGVIVNEHSKD